MEQTLSILLVLAFPVCLVWVWGRAEWLWALVRRLIAAPRRLKTLEASAGDRVVVPVMCGDGGVVNVLEWLASQPDGLKNDSEEVRIKLAQFNLLWSFFEKQLLVGDATSRTLGRVADLVSTRGVGATPPAIAAAVDVARQLHAPGTRLLVSLDVLRLYSDQNRKVIEAVLLGQDDTLKSSVVCLLSLYRQYNRLLFYPVIRWHGVYRSAEQIDCFTSALVAVSNLVRWQPASEA